nr:ribonuclease H-like domain-containing protein [Tanacetum cinerariifolium]
MLEILSRRFFLKLNLFDHRSILTNLQETLKGKWRYLIPAKPPIHNPLGKFQGNVDEGFLVGYSVCSKAFRVFNSRTRIIHETLHTMNYHPVIAENQSNTHAGFQDTEKAGEEGTQTYVLFPVLSNGSTNSQNNNKDAHANGKEHDDDIHKSVTPDIHSSRSDSINDFSAASPSNAAMPNLEDLSHDADDVGEEADINNLESIISVSLIPTTRIHKDHPTSQIIGDLSLTTQTRSIARAVRDQALCQSFEKLMKDKFQMSSMGELTFFLALQVKQKKDGIFISQDKYVAEILKKFGLSEGKSASTPIDAEKPLLKDSDGEDVDVHTY